MKDDVREIKISQIEIKIIESEMNNFCFNIGKVVFTVLRGGWRR